MVEYDYIPTIMESSSRIEIDMHSGNEIKTFF
jgi:hypothetical protein